jgi:N-acetylmuramoyl-L-alanine amidase
MKLIREGDRSQEVADVQTRLRMLGVEVDDETGWYGPPTRKAVMLFQQQRGILADGIVGPNTWSELVEAGWRLGDRVLYLAYPPMRGDDVVTLQRSFNALGFVSGREDGIFGGNTDAAVRAFQKEYGVSEDGIFGPRTLGALQGLRVDRPGTAAAIREELRRGRAEGIRGALIMIDPGHGGDEQGVVGPHGFDEAEVCWDLARRIAMKLVGEGARVRFTRTETDSPDATARAQQANSLEADIFVSLHMNAHDEVTAEGASTFFFGGSRSGEALAEHIQTELVSLGVRDCRSHARAYPILKETRMPAVLVEPAFITNPDEEKRLEDPDFRAAVSSAIAAGINRYYASAQQS